MRQAMLALALGAALSAGMAEARAPRHAATITRTTYGIPHIVAKDWAGAGYGVGYAYAQDNLCLLAEEFATIAGERSLHWGPKGVATLGFEKIDNLSSDLFFRATFDLAAARRDAAKQSPAARAVTAGYVAGYNRYLRDVGAAGVPAACRGKPWVRPIGSDDMLRLNAKQMALASSLAFAPFVVAAAPPGVKAAAAPSRDPTARPDAVGFGSNGWAFGGEATADGKGLLVGNPHFPWEGPARFWQMHVTIPGQYDAMGVSLAGGPIVSLGFNRDVAWTHTVTAAQHFTLFELKLDPADPTAYFVDGKRVPMIRRTVSVPMPDGAAPVVRTFYASRFGPMVVSPFIGVTWNKDRAYALRDANAGNFRSLDTWIAIGRARTVGGVRAAVSRSLGIPWVNTIAADRAGNILHADVTAVPNVTAASIARCEGSLTKTLSARLVLIDGSRAACDWKGLLPAREQAVWARRDYVANSNDSYWLSNPAAPYRTLSPILGAAGTERSLRTRSGLVEIAAMLAGGKVDHARAESTILAGKSLAADLTLEPLLALCRSKAEVAAACEALARWDRRFELDSRGAYLFTALWDAARPIPDKWRVKFDPADPVNTPRDLDLAGDKGTKWLAALAAAQARLAKEGIAPDARWGDVQFAVRGDARIPIHGGDGRLGVLNMQMSEPVKGGIVPRHGTSYIQVVGFDAAGPVADAMLSYSQSTDPASPHDADQTLAFSGKRWQRLPFSREAIARAAIGAPRTIGE